MGSLVWLLVPLVVAGGAILAVAGPTTRVSVNSAGEEANGESAFASISASGRFEWPMVMVGGTDGISSGSAWREEWSSLLRKCTFWSICLARRPTYN